MEPSAFPITSIAFGPCSWKRYDLRRPSLRSERPHVELELHVVAAGLGVEGDPVHRGRAADEVEPVLLELEEDHVADHVALRGARHEVLRPVDAEALEAVDRETREQGRRVRPFHRQIVHVVRLVEEDARLLPRALLVPPVRVLGRHPGKTLAPDGLLRNSSTGLRLASSRSCRLRSPTSILRSPGLDPPGGHGRAGPCGRGRPSAAPTSAGGWPGAR